MPEKKVWFSTGAARGMGVDSATAALAAGNAVVATGREPRAIEVADRPDPVSLARPSSRRPVGTSAGQRGSGLGQ